MSNIDTETLRNNRRASAKSQRAPEQAIPSPRRHLPCSISRMLIPTSTAQYTGFFMSPQHWQKSSLEVGENPQKCFSPAPAVRVYSIHRREKRSAKSSSWRSVIGRQGWEKLTVRGSAAVTGSFRLSYYVPSVCAASTGAHQLQRCFWFGGTSQPISGTADFIDAVPGKSGVI